LIQNPPESGKIISYMDKTINNPIILYKNRFEVRLERETVWLSLNQMAHLFERDKSVVSRHLKNVFSEHELIEKSVVAKIATTDSVTQKWWLSH